MKRNVLPVVLVFCCVALSHGAKVLVNYTPQTVSHAMGLSRCIQLLRDLTTLPAIQLEISQEIFRASDLYPHV